MKSTVKKLKYVTLSVAAAMLLAACGDKEAATPASAEKVYELKVGYGQSTGATLFDIAELEGFFEDENLEVTGVGFASSADGLNALQAGKIDVGMTFGTAAPLTFIANGSDFSIIGGHLEGGHPILARPENADDYQTLEDFKGKRVGTIRMFTSDIVFRGALADVGIDWATDLQIMEFKTGGDLLQAVSSGKVDVAVSAGSTYLAAQESGLEAIMWSNDLNPTHVCCRIVTQTDDLTEDDGEAYKRFLKALIRAERVKNEDPEKAVAASMKHYKLDEETVDSIVNEENANYSADPNAAEVTKMWQQLQDIGYVADVEDIVIENHIFTDLYTQALEELKTDHPEDVAYYEELEKRFAEQNA